MKAAVLHELGANPKYEMAKYRGASKVIATGRNERTLQTLKSLGADEIISLKQSDDTIINRLKEIQNETPVDIRNGLFVGTLNAAYSKSFHWF